MVSFVAARNALWEFDWRLSGAGHKEKQAAARRDTNAAGVNEVGVGFAAGNRLGTYVFSVWNNRNSEKLSLYLLTL